MWIARGEYTSCISAQYLITARCITAQVHHGHDVSSRVWPHMQCDQAVAGCLHCASRHQQTIHACREDLFQQPFRTVPDAVCMSHPVRVGRSADANCFNHASTPQLLHYLWKARLTYTCLCLSSFVRMCTSKLETWHWRQDV